MIYLDQAATSFPKPPAVVEEMTAYLTEVGGNPGRSGHSRSLAAGRLVFAAREALAKLLSVKDSRRIAFTHSTTESLNIAIFGVLRKRGSAGAGLHVVTTSMEHNSVIRPLRYLQRTLGIDVEIVQAGSDGLVDASDVRRALRPSTALVAVNHGSNVTGTVQDLRKLRKAAEGVPLLVDAAQTAGVLDLPVEEMGLDLVAFPGHKALLGPPGTGGLYVREGLALEPFLIGGTGSISESEEQPEFMPDVLESGTLNVAGIAGLGGALRFLAATGREAIRLHEEALASALLEGLGAIRGVRIYGRPAGGGRLPVVSLTVAGKDPAEMARILDREHGILTRAGLQCASLAHRTIGTFPTGTLRLSAGWFNTLEEVRLAVEALERVAAQSGR